MKIALILSSNIKLNPYIEIFRKLLQQNNIDFDIISWDRESLDEQEGIIYKYPASNTRSVVCKIVDYYKFSCFVKKIIRTNKYDKLIVFGAAIGVFMCNYLNKYYRNKFWLDYRDLTIEQKFMRRFKKLCDISQYISISSPGFEKAFPSKYDFILSHNFDIDEVRQAVSNKSLADNENISKRPYRVATIGGIRDYCANVEVIGSLKNNPEFELYFIGRGPQAEPLNQYVQQNGINNVSFQGFYLKKDEWQFYQQADFINIYYPRIKSHETALSNRFYKSMIFCKPMIVTNRSTQGEYIEKYGLGLSLEDCSLLPVQIEEYMSNFNAKLFSDKSNELLIQFIADYDNFKVKFLEFISHD